MRPAPAILGVAPYEVARPPQPIDLDLRGNEGARGPADDAPRPAEVHLRGYPDARPLEAALAARLGSSAAQVVVTAGADEALDRVCRAVLCPGRVCLLPTPGFAMTTRYAAATGCEVVSIPWDGEFPLSAMLEADDGRVALVGITSPNNPTGAVVSPAQVATLSEHFPDAVVLVDLAYVEYADHDPTEELLRHPNVVVVRTFSKAWGLAGLRVGWAAGPAEVVRWIRAAGSPYPVSAWSLATAESRLRRGVPADHVRQVRDERGRITAALREHGVAALDSGANFVFARTPEAAWLHDGLAGLGIAVRGFEGAVRIGCPGDEPATQRLLHTLGAVLRPEAVLFDVDGVLVDVSGSYRRAIVETAATFGVTVTPDDIRRIKAQGGANDDWDVTWRLVGGSVGYDEVQRRFEQLYQGGLWRNERLRLPADALRRLARQAPIALVTGRPRADLERLLLEHGLADLSLVAVCREDGPNKPDPWPVAEALRRLGRSSAWMLGDTVDDVRAARAAGVVPIGVLAPGDTDPEPLVRAGAARVWSDPSLALPPRWSRP